MVRELGGIVDTSFMRTHHPYCYAVNQFMTNRENVFFDSDGDRLFELQHSPPGLPGQRGPEPPDTPGQVILHTEAGCCYLIMDAQQLENYGAVLLKRADPVHDDFATHWREDIEVECALEDRPARKAETIRALAAKLGMAPDRLERSVARYNELCARGCDEDLGKPAQFMRPIQTAPFYAFIVQDFDNGASLGGVAAKSQTILQRNWSPNHNLYQERVCTNENGFSYLPTDRLPGAQGAQRSGAVGAC